MANVTNTTTIVYTIIMSKKMDDSSPASPSSSSALARLSMAMIIAILTISFGDFIPPFASFVSMAGSLTTPFSSFSSVGPLTTPRSSFSFSVLIFLSVMPMAFFSSSNFNAAKALVPRSAIMPLPGVCRRMTSPLSTRHLM